MLAAILLRGFAVLAVKVASGSMLPTLQIGDHVLVSPLSYGLRIPLLGGWVARWADPLPGDVVVFAGPRDAEQDFVKRVAAVGGERVELRDGELFVDGRPRPLPDGVPSPPRGNVRRPAADTFGPVAVPKGKLFVLGDSRDRSIDSRAWGFVDVGDVRGRAGNIYWSMDGDDGWIRWERLGRAVR